MTEKKSYYESFVAEVREALFEWLDNNFRSYRYPRKEIKRITREIMKDLRKTFEAYGVDWKLSEE